MSRRTCPPLGGRLFVALLALTLTTLSGVAASAQRHPLVWIGDAGSADRGLDAIRPALETLGISFGGPLDTASAGRLAPAELYSLDVLSRPGLTLPEILADLEAGLDGLAARYPGFDPPCLIGRGYGGLVAAHFAAENSHRVQGAVAIGSPLSAGVADPALRLGALLAAARAGRHSGPDTARAADRQLLDSWTEFATRQTGLVQTVFSTPPLDETDAGEAIYELVRAAWGWPNETLAWLAGLEQTLTGRDYGDRLRIVPLPVLPATIPDDPVTLLLALAAETLNAPPGATRLTPPAALTRRANGVLALSSQLPLGLARPLDALPVQFGFALPGGQRLAVPLASGTRRVPLPPLIGPFRDLSGLQAALERLGWKPWRATLRDAAWRIRTCRELSQEAREATAPLALVLHPSSPVLESACGTAASDSEPTVSSLGQLAGMPAPETVVAGQAGLRSLPDLLVADSAVQIARLGPADSEATRIVLVGRKTTQRPEPAEWIPLEDGEPHWNAIRLLQELFGFEALEIVTDTAGGLETFRVPIDETVEDLVVLSFGPGAQPLLSGSALSGSESRRLAVERLRLQLRHLPRPAPGWLVFDSTGIGPGLAVAVLARTRIESTMEVHAPRSGGVDATACLRVVSGEPPEMGRTFAWLRESDRSYPLSSLVNGACLEIRSRRFEPSGDGRLNVRLEGLSAGGFAFRRVRSAAVASSARRPARPRPVGFALPTPATVVQPAARAPLAAVEIETVEEHLLLFDEGRFSNPLAPFRDRRVVVALASKPTSHSIGRYYHQVVSQDLLEMDRKDPFLSRLEDGTPILLYGQKDYLWNRTYAWAEDRPPTRAQP